MKRFDVGVLGATGAVGQKFIRLLDGHPQFRLTEVCASERSQGKGYGEAVHWLEDIEIPKMARDLPVKGPGARLEAPIQFSALPTGEAGPLERDLSRRGHAVFTNARDLRMEADVPLVIAEVNPEHLELVKIQKKASRTAGFVVANGNCTAIVLAMSLKPILDRFGVRAATMVSLQSLSGAGYPGVPSLDIVGNVLPYIRNEEERVRMETPRFLGTLRNGAVAPSTFTLASTCTRVAVAEGHTEVISVRPERKASLEEVREAFASFSGRPQKLKLPTAPHPPIVVRPEPDRPQPKKDQAAGGGMAVVVGRIAEDPVIEGFRYVALGSNTVRGAAGGSILNAELCAREGYLG